MKKTVKNIIFGSLAFTAGVALFNLVRTKAKREKEIIVETEEMERKYIDLSDQLGKLEDENKELKKEVEDIKVKEYTA